MLARSEIEKALPQFTGTEAYHATTFRLFNATDGVAYLREAADCHWLVDAIESHQLDRKVRAEGFQVWKLTVSTDSVGVLVCEDGNDNVVKTQRLGWTDFPLPEISLWLVNRVLMLPSEY